MFHKDEANKRKRRDHLNVIADILEAAKKGVSKTEIMYKAGLNSWLLTRYISFLARLGLIAATSKSEKPFYKTTSKGTLFLKTHEEIRHLLPEKESTVP